MAATTRSAPNPSSSGGSPALRWIQKVVRPAEAAPAMSQELDDTEPIAVRPTCSRSIPKTYTRGLTLKILTGSSVLPAPDGTFIHPIAADRTKTSNRRTIVQLQRPSLSPSRRATDWSPCFQGIPQTPLHTCALSSPGGPSLHSAARQPAVGWHLRPGVILRRSAPARIRHTGGPWRASGYHRDARRSARGQADRHRNRSWTADIVRADPVHGRAAGGRLLDRSSRN